MRGGLYISGTAHAALIGWLVLGWGLASAPLKFDVTEVSIISGTAFDQALRAGTPMAEVENSPMPVVADAIAPPPPQPAAEARPAPPAEAQTPARPAQRPAPPAPAREAQLAPPPPPAPPIRVPDAPPQAPLSPVAAPAPNLTQGDSAVARPAASPRIAARPVAPRPDAAVADVAQTAPKPAPAPAEPQIEPETETTAPPEAATEIVTEAEPPSAAPEISLRPQARPPAPAPAPEPEKTEPETPPAEETPAPETPDQAAPAVSADDIAAALEDALAAPSAQQGAETGTLSAHEVGTFLGQISQCWNMAAASTDAQQTTVSLIFRLTPQGLVEPGSIQRAGFRGGDAGAAEIAYRVAEQAVTECQTRGRMGYDLPPERYELWRELKIHFNPETMRLR